MRCARRKTLKGNETRQARFGFGLASEYQSDCTSAVRRPGEIAFQSATSTKSCMYYDKFYGGNDNGGLARMWNRLRKASAGEVTSMPSAAPCISLSIYGTSQP